MAAINSKDLFIQTIVPRLLSQTYTVNDLSINLQVTNLVVNLILPEEVPKYIKNFIVKLWRQGEGVTGTYATDWWGQAWDADNMMSITTLSTATFNLLNMSNTPVKRISEIGINYQIACRAVDINDNISSKSMLGSILLKTIS